MSSGWNKKTVEGMSPTPEQANEKVWGNRRTGRGHRSDVSERSDRSYRTKNRSVVSSVQFDHEHHRSVGRGGRVYGHKDLEGYYFGLDVEGQEANFLETKKFILEWGVTNLDMGGDIYALIVDGVDATYPDPADLTEKSPSALQLRKFEIERREASDSRKQLKRDKATFYYGGERTVSTTTASKIGEHDKTG